MPTPYPEPKPERLGFALAIASPVKLGITAAVIVWSLWVGETHLLYGFLAAWAVWSFHVVRGE